MELRKPVAVLSVSVACLLAIMGREGFAPVARPPLPGDVPTYGYGSTFKADGSRVRDGDRITEPEARTLMVSQVRDVFEAGVRRCTADLKLYQREWDFLIQGAHNFGIERTCQSGMVREFRKENYAEGCAYILKYVYFQGKDCRIPANHCGGIPKDRERAYRACMGFANE